MLHTYSECGSARPRTCTPVAHEKERKRPRVRSDFAAQRRCRGVEVGGGNGPGAGRLEAGFKLKLEE